MLNKKEIVWSNKFASANNLCFGEATIPSEYVVSNYVFNLLHESTECSSDRFKQILLEYVECRSNLYNEVNETWVMPTERDLLDSLTMTIQDNPDEYRIASSHITALSHNGCIAEELAELARTEGVDFHSHPQTMILLVEFLNNRFRVRNLLPPISHPLLMLENASNPYWLYLTIGDLRPDAHAATSFAAPLSLYFLEKRMFKAGDFYLSKDNFSPHLADDCWKSLVLNTSCYAVSQWTYSTFSYALQRLAVYLAQVTPSNSHRVKALVSLIDNARTKEDLFI